MGNLNCFSSYRRDKKRPWFDEWQNNSSYPHPYEYYDQRNDMYPSTSGPMIMGPSQDPELLNYYYQQSHPQQPIMHSYHKNPPSYVPQEGDRDVGTSVVETRPDSAQEAFMSDWLAREEAELQGNIRDLQRGSPGSVVSTKKSKVISSAPTSGRETKHKKKHHHKKKKKSEKKRSKKSSKKHKKRKQMRIDGDHGSDGSSDSSSSSTADSSSSSSTETSSNESDMCKIDSAMLTTKTELKPDTLMGFSTKRSGKCCYTAYIMCNNTADWENFLKRTARFMTGLQRQFQCVLKFSDKISFFRGNSVRTFQIVGPQKSNVIRCKAALPKPVSQMLITPLTGSAEVEEYSRECNYARLAASRRNLAAR